MTKVIHNIDSLLFRDPAGAQPVGSQIHLTLLIEADASFHPVMHLRFDKESREQVLPMEPSKRATSSGPLFNAYKITLTPEEKGLYWYWFELIPGDYDPARRSLSDTHRPGYLPGATMIGRDSGTGQAVITNDPHAWQITVFDPSYEDPDWIRGGVFYHIFVDRFARSGRPIQMDGKDTRSDWGGMPYWQPTPQGEILNNDFFGGNLAGIRKKLPYLHDLGVTCLYLSPIFEAFSNHKYDTSDYMKVDPMFGDEKGFTRLCREAKKLGIRVICDGVFSHTGSDSRYFDIFDRYGDGACHHPDSPYRDWYYFEPDGWQCWWGIRTLPRINKENPSYQEFMAGKDGVIRHWLRAGASGWRLDVVDELPSSFLEKLTAAAKEEKPDALMLGEVWEDASNKVAYEERKNYFEGDKLDSVMNYPLRRGIIDYVREGDAMALARPMSMILTNYPMRVVHALMNILGTHDTERIITALAGTRLGPNASRADKASICMDAVQWAVGLRRLKIAVVLQMTLPGVPCIYYGDEAGMEGYNDPFNRKCYPWGSENKDLQDWYRRVIRIRRDHAVYTDGGYRLLAARDGLFAFERSRKETASNPDAKAGGTSVTTAGKISRMVTAANCGQEQQTLPLLGAWRDLLSDFVFIDDVIVLPGQAMILTPEKKG